MGQGELNKLEKKILEFWRQNNIFQKSLQKNQGRENFVFYEGPPTANAKPGIHFVMPRVFKDVFPRYKTMRGFYVKRKGGWDTHGLPVELEVEKELGLNSKPEIEKYGIAKFNQKARASVWKYKQEMEALTERIGFWIDLQDPYITYEPEYIESLWWIIKQFDKKGLLYKDFRVSPYCPRCGTPLSSHEVAQGYQTITDTSVIVKFQIPNPKFQTNSKFQILNSKQKVYLLAWTTTPWTLPGNVALAVGKDIDYVLAKPSVRMFRNIRTQETYILAKNLINKVLGEDYEILAEFKGRDLKGLKYKPLFNINLLQNESSHQVYLANFVSTDEGTGIVHTAAMYGEEDFELGSQVGLPKQHTVDEQGRFNQLLKPFGLAGRPVKDSATEKQVIDYLRTKGLLLKQEPYQHDYPHCWRCESALIYYALESYFVATTKLKKQLIKNNQKINWVPAHFKQGRFGQFLKELKDWAFSRSRYWGTPLPVWRCQPNRITNKESKIKNSPNNQEGCGNYMVIGSLQELDERAYYKNNFTILRHGGAESNSGNLVASSLESDTYQLTGSGKKSIEKIGQQLKKQGVDVIFASPFKRTRQTAEIVAQATGAKVHIDQRLKEIAAGELDGKTVEEYHAFFDTELERFKRAPAGGENLTDVKKRALEFLQEVNSSHQGANILIVAHEDVLWMIEAVAKGLSNKAALALPHLATGQYRPVKFHNYPRNDQGRVDLHRPFVDEIILKCPECGGKMKRVEYVVDVWFDSGSMPFAQYHYPFENQELQKQQYPADFIAEGIDQTRGWFYTLHAVSTLLGQGPAFKNVISHGHLLDAEGKKMSKSRGNVVEPWPQIEKYGADAIRWFLYVVNPPGEPKRYDEKELKAHTSQFLLTLLNSLRFWQLAGKQPAQPHPGPPQSSPLDKGKEPEEGYILDQWLASRLASTTWAVTQAMDSYQLTEAARTLEQLVDDLSNWYIRRSRQRLRQDERAWQFLGGALLQIAKLIAPFTPFLAENIYQNLHPRLNPPPQGGGGPESVHLADWPEAKEKLIDKKLEQQMQTVRQLASLALEQRAQAGIKVRQPLKQLTVGDWQLTKELLQVLKEEVNVKEIKINKRLNNKVILDTEITEELKQEGLLRDLLRRINSTRQQAGLNPADQITLKLQSTKAARQLVKKFKQELKQAAGVADLQLVKQPAGSHSATLKTNQQELTFAIDLSKQQ